MYSNSVSQTPAHETPAITSFLSKYPATRQPLRMPITFVQVCVARAYGLTREQMLDTRRSANLAQPRMIAMFLARELCSASYPEIANAFKKLDHTTAMYAEKKIQERCAENPMLAKQIGELRQTLKALYADLRSRDVNDKEVRALLFNLAA